MLDIIRKRAQSWVTVVIFGVIVIVFIFFFGFNELGPGTANGPSVVAKVNGLVILNGEFQLAVENNTAFYREMFKDDVPEPIAKGIQPATLQQLINQKLLVSAARDQGLRIGKEELAEKIRSLPYLQKDGQFDITFYKEVFLPQMQRRYQIDFENLIQNELLVDKMESFVKASVQLSPLELRQAFDQEKTAWTFEVIELDPDSLVAAKKIPEADQVESIAKELQAGLSQPAVRDRILKTYGLAAKNIGPISLNAYRQLLGADASTDDYKALFALTKAAPLLAAPLKIGRKWMVVRLERVARPSEEEWKKETAQFTERARKEKADERVQQWLASLGSKARIRRYINLDAS